MNLALQAARASLTNATDSTLKVLCEELRTSLGAKVQQFAVATDDALLDAVVSAVGVLGLLHDIGHTPLSHTLEHFFSDYSTPLLGQLPQADEADAVADITPHEHWGGSSL
jgi:HD superfamily phosphohydrolase